ncbi:hypothetical protein NDU88_001985 [Pleurodeles waltl]|uniref:Uncharacterized protein n=1 Tax=Pleurodeles waltl TaxID=8319 RepID=A0AAV7U966_PLEWA|nr:hypothetical protein NDU88_001985 [Pleurodeles waltl]
MLTLAIRNVSFSFAGLNPVSARSKLGNRRSKKVQPTTLIILCRAAGDVGEPISRTHSCVRFTCARLRTQLTNQSVGADSGARGRSSEAVNHSGPCRNLHRTNPRALLAGFHVFSASRRDVCCTISALARKLTVSEQRTFLARSACKRFAQPRPW